MRSEIILPRRSLAIAVTLGAGVGAVFLGVGGRIAMYLFAVLEGRATGWTVGGSMTVVFMGAAWGTPGGLLLWAGRRWFPRSAAARGVTFWIPLTLLYLSGLRPLNGDSLMAFTPFYLAYGVVLYRMFCRRYVTRWAASAAAAPAH